MLVLQFESLRARHYTILHDAVRFRRHRPYEPAKSTRIASTEKWRVFDTPKLGIGEFGLPAPARTHVALD
jgi:hypothetical protein